MSADTIVVEGLVDLYCKELKLPGLRADYRELARDALNKGIAPAEFLLSCLEQEVSSRKQHRLQSRMRGAKFPVVKTLDTFDFRVIPNLPKAKVLSLADGQFIRQKENVICLGPSGTGESAPAAKWWSPFGSTRRRPCPQNRLTIHLPPRGKVTGPIARTCLLGMWGSPKPCRGGQLSRCRGGQLFT